MKNFSLGSMRKKTIKSYSLFLLFYFFISFNILGQICPACSDNPTIKTYNKPDSHNGGVNNNQNQKDDDEDWTPKGEPAANEIAKFDKLGNFIWMPNRSTTIKGIILENNANLTIDRFSQGNTAFIIAGIPASKACVIVRKGSTLTLKYISNLINVNICVEEGGKIVFDARDGSRNDYLFDGVDINLQGPDAKIEFGDADIKIGNRGLVVVGYTPKEGCKRDSDGKLILPNPPPNISADPNKTNLEDFCNFLTQAGFPITSLPVEWLYVKSQFNSTERSSTINWATAKEWENSHFEIERSINGISNWEKIGEVQGMGWTDEVTEYSFCDDRLPIGGGNVYYRLKQVDFNLKFEYSKTVTVRVPPLTVTKGKWRVYPNPVNDVNFYIARTELEEISSISVKMLSSQDQMRSIKVANERELTEAVKKGFDKLPKGVFIIEIQWNQKVEYLKVIKN